MGSPLVIGGKLTSYFSVYIIGLECGGNVGALKNWGAFIQNFIQNITF